MTQVVQLRHAQCGTDGTSPILDWFTTYPVTEVDTSDNAGLWGADASPARVTKYSYADAAWHRDDSPFTPTDRRTWGQFRGYATVTTRTGASPDPVTETVTHYLQGMDGDLRSGGTPRSVSVSTASGDTITDSDDLAGYAYQSDTYSASGGTLQQVLVRHPWRSAATATHTRAGLPALVARLHGTDRTDTRQRLAAGSWRVARVATVYDASTGLPVKVDDLGRIDASGQPVGGSTPERCTTTSYASDTARNMLAYPSQVITDQGACGSTVSSRTLSATRTYYDGSATLGQLAGPGNPTASQALQDASPVAWQPAATATFDAYGRPTGTTDPLGRSSSTSYGTTAATRKYLPVHLATTNAKNWTTSTTLDPARGLPTSITDPNGRITSESYDGLGRLIKVWLPSHPKSSYASTPSRTYTYRVNRSSYVAVTSKSLLDSGYATSITIYDGLLQPRQVQSDPANDAAASRMVTDTRYDSHGWSVATDQAFFNDASAPATTPVTVATAAPAQTRTSYDGRGRVTRSALYSGGTYEWATTTAYPGADQTAVTPPAGGTPTRAILDARGQRTQLRQYHGASPSGTYDVTYYGYDAAGRMTSMAGPLAQGTDPSGAPATWSWSFDAAGNQVSASDPDSGTTTRAYDADGEVTSTTDAAGQQLTTSYDVLGRKTAVRDGGSAGVKLASWSYDTAGAKGQLASATGYAADGTTPTYTRTIAGYTVGYQPTAVSETVPAGAYGNSAALTRTTTNYYTSVLGNLYMQQIGLSGTGGLAGSETLFRAYSGMGLPVTLGGDDSYVSWTNYDPHGRVVRATSAAMPDQVAVTYAWDEPTGRLVNVSVSKEDGAAAVDDVDYSYTASGQVTSVTDSRDIDGAGAAHTDRQCYAYDYLGRLATAWTSSGPVSPASPGVGAVGACATAASSSALSGPAPYWTSYSYDLAGNRTGLTEHPTSAGGSGSSTTSAFGVTGHVHALASTTTGSRVSSYSYDAAGRTTARTVTTAGTAVPARAEALSWTPQGRLASVRVGPAANPTHTVSYGYGPDGNLAAQTLDGATTLFLGGDAITLDTTGTVNKVVRHYPFPGAATAVRVITSGSDELHYQAADPQGSGITDITAGTLTVTRRGYTPFGTPRPDAGAGTSWAGQKGFLDAVHDPTDTGGTGLTVLGARVYDPTQGRFLTVDPLLDTSDPQQANGYTYADNTPITKSDPTGTRPINDTGNDINTCWSVTGNLSCGGSSNKTLGWVEPAQRSTHPKDYTTKHAAVVRAAANRISGQAAELGYKNYHVETELQIGQASKKCMGLDDLEGCYSGRADIVLLVPIYDASGRQVAINAYVWEVKAFSRRGAAQGEAMHYADRMRGKPLPGGNVPVTSAVIGWNIGGPYGGVGGYPKTKYWSASRNGGHLRGLG